MEDVRQEILLLFFTFIDVVLPVPALFQRIPHQAFMYGPLPEIKLAVNPSPYLPGVVGTYGPCQDHIGKDKGSHGVPLPINPLSPLCSQYCIKPAPNLTGAHGLPDI